MGLQKTRRVLSVFFLLALIIKAGEVKSTVELVANGKGAEEHLPASENQPKISAPVNTPINKTPIDNKRIDTKRIEAIPLTKETLEGDPMRIKEGRRYDFKGQQRRWIELHGSLNKQYVYLIVEKMGKRDIAGYLFDGKGNHTYVYGEWFNGQLQVYDQANKNLTIMLHD
jgi:hypothetical protein